MKIYNLHLHSVNQSLEQNNIEVEKTLYRILIHFIAFSYTN